jgi:hypothetical protein
MNQMMIKSSGWSAESLNVLTSFGPHPDHFHRRRRDHRFVPYLGADALASTPPSYGPSVTTNRATRKQFILKDNASFFSESKAWRFDDLQTTSIGCSTPTAAAHD